MNDVIEADLRPAIYARVLAEEQREGQTIDSQIGELESFAESNGGVMDLSPILDTGLDSGNP